MFTSSEAKLINIIIDHFKCNEPNKLSLLICASWNKIIKDPLISTYLSRDNLNRLDVKMMSMDNDSILDDTQYNLMMYILDVVALYNTLSTMDTTIRNFFDEFSENILTNMYIFSHNNNKLFDKINELVTSIIKFSAILRLYQMDVFTRLRDSSAISNTNYIQTFRNTISIQDNSTINIIRILVKHDNEAIQKIKDFITSLLPFSMNQLAYLFSINIKNRLIIYDNISKIRVLYLSNEKSVILISDSEDDIPNDSACDKMDYVLNDIFDITNDVDNNSTAKKRKFDVLSPENSYPGFYKIDPISIHVCKSPTEINPAINSLSIVIEENVGRYNVSKRYIRPAPLISLIDKSNCGSIDLDNLFVKVSAYFIFNPSYCVVLNKQSILPFDIHKKILFKNIIIDKTSYSNNNSPLQFKFELIRYRNNYHYDILDTVHSNWTIIVSKKRSITSYTSPRKKLSSLQTDFSEWHLPHFSETSIAPYIGRIEPNIISIKDETVLRIMGTGFEENTRVRIKHTEYTDITVISSSLLEMKYTAYLLGNHEITLITSSGWSNTYIIRVQDGYIDHNYY